jgi:putative NADH-flavin reductase
MKLTIFGATGKTGTELVKKALQQGHQVTAFVRDPAKITIQNANLRLVKGDVRDAVQVASAVQGSDAVVSALGPTGNKDEVIGVAADNLISAMKKHQVRRLVTITGAGVGDPNDQPKLINHIISFLLKTTALKVYEQSLLHAQKVRASQLDWTIVRVPMLTDDPGTGSLRVGHVGVGTGSKLPRQDLASFILEEVCENRHIGKAPMISG